MVRSQDSRSSEAMRALERLGRMSLRNQSMEGLLQTVADLAKSVVSGTAESSVLLLIGDKPTTPVCTSPIALELDESQYEHDYGPCLHAARTGDVVEVTDAKTEPRWRGYMDSAVEHGYFSSLSLPLPIREGIAGALNIYAREPNAFDEDSRLVATQFAPYAAVAAGNLYEYQTARATAENLRRALESRAVIDQAKGILMERHKLTADQAFQILARASMHRNVKVHAIAEHLVLTGEFLGR
jgi:GAF domain-containing protein